MAQRTEKVEIPASVARKILDVIREGSTSYGRFEKANHIIKSRGCRLGSIQRVNVKRFLR